MKNMREMLGKGLELELKGKVYVAKDVYGKEHTIEVESVVKVENTRDFRFKTDDSVFDIHVKFKGHSDLFEFDAIRITDDLSVLEKQLTENFREWVD